MDYIAAHPTIAEPEKFTLSDADYEEFKQRVLRSNFSYDRESEKFLKELVKLAKFEGYYEEARAEFEQLEKKLSHNLSKDLDFNKEALKKLIAGGIIPAYYFQKGRIRHTLASDKQMKAAIELLGDAKRYDDILRTPAASPKKKAG